MTIDLASLDELFAQRRSVRGFISTPVARDTLVQIFTAAQRAPSWCNIQPWRVVVTEPPATDAVRAQLVAAAKSSEPSPDVPFPVDYPEPYLTHRRACGHALYGAMGIARTDHARRQAAWIRNFELFDAPHFAVVSVDHRLGPYAMLDIGVWLGLVVTAATAAGVATCPLASIAAFPAPLRAALPIDADHHILFGIAIGFADDQVAANQCRTDRAPIDANIRFVQ